jgi:GalNAc-alpha-(1->4)-GalNAc-alpha-(1->3)-diNAcBac-PP-undecaprenol alpha-1,4-N-acetyl-D-galactosaminyltransferase
MKYRKRICLIVPTLKRGGMERVMSMLADYFYKEGHDIYVILLIKSEIEYSVNNEIKIMQPTFKYNKSFIFKLKVFKYLIKNINFLNPNTILSFGEYFNNMSIIASIICNKEIYISDRSSPMKKSSMLNKLLTHFFYPKAKGIVAQTEFAKKIFSEKNYNKNIINIANPLKKLDKNNYRENESKIILTIGKLDKWKNQEELIRIFSNIHIPDWRLYIVGNGPLFSHLEVIINKLNLSDRVFLIGESDNIDYWLGCADIFAYVSLSEGFPNALSEAVAYSLPSISYDCCAGPNEIIINRENGFLIPPNNRNEFQYKLELLMSNKQLREMFKSNGLRNRERFSIDNIGSKYLDFILN